jgi:peptide chain release factor 2
MAQPGFWDNAERAQGIVQKKKLCFQVVDPIDTLTALSRGLSGLLELGAEDPAAVEADLVETERKINERLDQLEFQLMLGGEHDPMNAIITLQSGAGGVDASDWAEMMLRMYIKWATKHDYEFEETDFQKAEEAGIKSATLMIKRAVRLWSSLKAEQGVHRLVRISPFDGQGRRQTSFASVEVVPGARRRRGRGDPQGRPQGRHVPQFGRWWSARQQDRVGDPHHAHSLRHYRRVPGRT